MKKMFPKKIVGLLIVILLATSSAGWFAEGLRDMALAWFAPPNQAPSLLWWRTQFIGVVLSCLLFLRLSYYIYLKRSMFSSRNRLSAGTFSPHKCLIMFVSEPKQKKDIPLPIPGRLALATDKGNTELTFESFYEDLGRLVRSSILWNWEQPLVGVMKNKPELEEVILIGSSGERGSFDHLKTLEAIMQRYLENDVRVVCYDKAVDFNNFEEMLDHLIDIIKLKTSGASCGGRSKPTHNSTFKEEQIAVDVTGGTKLSSIAGAQATVNRKVTMQYVDTAKIEIENGEKMSEKDYGQCFFKKRKVIQWDLVTESPDNVSL